MQRKIDKNENEFRVNNHRKQWSLFRFQIKIIAIQNIVNYQKKKKKNRKSRKKVKDDVKWTL